MREAEILKDDLLSDCNTALSEKEPACCQDIRKAESGRSSGCVATSDSELVPGISAFVCLFEVRLHETFFHEADGERLFCLVCEAGDGQQL